MKQLEQRIFPAIPSLQRYMDILQKWQKSVNLVSNKTLKNAWQRHILDSAQLYFFVSRETKRLVDMGSGAGFPGLVLAVLNKHLSGTISDIILIESDMKKCLFLQEAARLLDLNVIILNQRIENTRLDGIDCVTARALAPIPSLLDWGRGMITPETTCLFLKGATVDFELQHLALSCQIKKHPSLTDPTGCIVQIKGVTYG